MREDFLSTERTDRRTLIQDLNPAFFYLIECPPETRGHICFKIQVVEGCLVFSLRSSENSSRRSSEPTHKPQANFSPNCARFPGCTPALEIKCPAVERFVRSQFGLSTNKVRPRMKTIRILTFCCQRPSP